jgi:hypothetical protein
MASTKLLSDRNLMGESSFSLRNVAIADGNHKLSEP